MHNVRHITQNAGCTTQNDGCTIQNVGCTKPNVSCTHLMFTKDQKGTGCPPGSPPAPIHEKILVIRNLEMIFRTFGIKNINKIKSIN